MISIFNRAAYHRVDTTSPSPKTGVFSKLKRKLPSLKSYFIPRAPSTPSRSSSPVTIDHSPRPTVTEITPLVAFHRAAALDALTRAKPKPQGHLQLRPTVFSLYAILECDEAKSSIGGFSPSNISSDCDYDPENTSVISEELFFNRF